MNAGTWVHPADGDTTVAEWVDQWWKGRHVNKPSTTARYRGVLDNHVLPTFGRRPLTALSRTEVQAWATELVARRSVGTARHALGLLRMALAAAVDDGVLVRNAAVGVRLPRAPRQEPSPLTHEQLWALASAVPSGRDRAMVLVAGYGGLRFGELVALRVRDVRASGRELHLRESVTDVDGVMHVGTLKDHESRVVPLPATVAGELRLYVKTLENERDALLFPSSAGTFLRNNNWRRNCLTPSAARVGLTLTPHHLRDTAASLAIAAGASVVAVARLLGHENSSTTLTHYATLFPGDLQHVADLMDTHACAAMNATNEGLRATGGDDSTDHTPTRVADLGPTK